MRVLAIDTCSDQCAAALLLDDGRVLKTEETMARGHAERLPGMIADLLDEAGLGYSDLNRIAVTVGPGSFSGIRVGLSMARGLALVLKTPVIGVSTLEALARTAANNALSKPPFLAVIDARRGEVYCQAFAASGEPLTSAMVLPVEAVRAEFERLIGERLFKLAMVGSGATLVADASPELADRVDSTLPRLLSIEAVLDLGAVAKAQESPPKPLYIRPPDAKPAPLTSRVARA